MTQWFRTRSTGMVWEVDEESDLCRRLLGSPGDYEQVPSPLLVPSLEGAQEEVAPAPEAPQPVTNGTGETEQDGTREHVGPHHEGPQTNKRHRRR